jgi:hypothetical protein
LAIPSPVKAGPEPRVAALGLRPIHPSFAGSVLMKIQTLEDFARPQDLAALRGVVSRLVIRFPENGEILDLIKAEYRGGGSLPAIEKAVTARIETGEALPHTIAKAQRDHRRKIRNV